MHTDRQIAVWGGWIAGPAFGVAMMAAPEYFHLKPILAALCFWGGILVFVVTVFVVAALQGREREGKKSMWPIYVMAAGVVVFGVGAAGFFWPQSPEPNSSENTSTSDPSARKTGAGILLDAFAEMFPGTAPTDGVILSFVIERSKDGIQAYPNKYQFNPNAAINWSSFFPDWPVWGIARWEITSSTSDPIFDAVIPLKLSFREMVPHAGEPVQIGTLVTSTNEKQMRSGDVVETKDIEIRIGRIRPQTPYVLYFVNRTERLVEIDVPSEGRTENFNKPELNIKFAMKLGRTSGLSLMPSSNASKVPQ